jgi:transcriptional regulator with XRE-family HTH domain
MTNTDMPEKVHHGRNVKRFREMLDMKQEAFAQELGSDWTQRKVSLLEQKETIEPEILVQIAKVLKVPVKAIENFTEKGAATYFNTFQDSSTNQVIGDNYGSYNFNPIEKWAEVVEKNEKLYERLLQTEREKIELLEKMLNTK